MLNINVSKFEYRCAESQRYRSILISLEAGCVWHWPFGTQAEVILLASKVASTYEILHLLEVD